MRGQTAVPSTTITKICEGAETIGSTTRPITELILRNTGNDTCYMQWTADDSSALDQGNGFPLASGDAIGISRGPTKKCPPVYGYCVGGQTAVINFSGH